ncbi:MAG: right-handed parallel beta-helix repeat-containing protein, partial [Chloroflexi bacterium]|nr:right-handed parallel beta-helix repeat-containing protein [Chloroflexota bacterium]
GIGYELIPSQSIDKIDYGDCESADEPMLAGETVPYIVGGGTWARSNTYSYAGTYSYKHTHNAAGVEAVYFTDNINTNDLHGVTPGKIYQFKLQTRRDSADDGTGDRYVIFQYYSGGVWSTTTFLIPDLSDQWVEMVGILIIPAAATGFKYGIESTQGLFDDPCIIYLDDIHLYEFDSTDSACQLVNSSVKDCTDIGIRVAANHGIIQNNQVIGNTNKGISIKAGYENLVSGNYCRDNGADTGIANANTDNFEDAGIDTLVDGNSWQI